MKDWEAIVEMDENGEWSFNDLYVKCIDDKKPLPDSKDKDNEPLLPIGEEE